MVRRSRTGHACATSPECVLCLYVPAYERTPYRNNIVTRYTKHIMCGVSFSNLVACSFCGLILPDYTKPYAIYYFCPLSKYTRGYHVMLFGVQMVDDEPTNSKAGRSKSF